MKAFEEPAVLFRVIDPRFGPNNIYRHQAKETASLGPIFIASAVRKYLPWEAEIILENNCRVNLGCPMTEDNLPDHDLLQRERRAEFVGISASMTNAVPRALEIIQLYRSMPEELRPKAIIVGGWHAGDSPEEFLEAGADVVVHGEGDMVIAPLLNALKQNRTLEDIPGISYWLNGQIKRNGPEFLAVPQEQMDNLPLPDFNLVRFAKIVIYPIGRTRGCSGKCRFCRVRSIPRSISPGRFLEQIKVLVSRGAKYFFIVDDRSEEDLEGFRQWLIGLINFREERKTRNLYFTSQNRLSLAEHPDVLSLMWEAGIRTVAIGFESPIPEELKAMKKPITTKLDQLLQWSQTFKDIGLYIHMMLILGYPMPPGANRVLNDQGKPMSIKERSHKFWQFIKKVNPATLQVLLYTPILGTPDWKLLEEQGRIDKEIGWEKYDGTWLTFKPDEGIDPQELQGEMIRLMQRFYSFPLIWKSGWTSVILHLIKIGVVTIAMPFVWVFNLPFKKWQLKTAWELPRRLKRNAKRRFLGYLIVLDWLESFKHSGFDAVLRRLARVKD